MARLISWNAAQARLALPHSTWSSIRTCLPLPHSPPASAGGAPAAPARLSSPPVRLAGHFSRAHSHHPGKSPVEAPSQTAAPEPVPNRAALQACLCLLAGVYVLWLFILPYAPGDPIWAIKLDTITMLLDLSLNFFFILPITNWLGIHVLESPAVHPTAEALFNVVMGWSVMFAPMLFSDRRRNRYCGSLPILWGVQMFLTNTVLIPYMAIRLNQESNMGGVSLGTKFDLSGVRKVMTSGARVVSVVCGTVGLISILWFFWGRPDEGFGNLSDRWTFFLEYLSSDRPGYAFVWDICLYSLFQPWLIGDNLYNVDKSKSEVIRYLSYVPYLGLVAYLWGLSSSEHSES